MVVVVFGGLWFFNQLSCGFGFELKIRYTNFYLNVMLSLVFELNFANLFIIFQSFLCFTCLIYLLCFARVR